MSMTEQDDFAGLEAFLPDLLPDDAIPVGSVLILEYLTPEGDTEHAYTVLGDIQRVHAFGLFEVGKWLMFDDMNTEDEADHDGGTE